MEVHPPHQPIHSWRDFFIHLFTITVGLLIALGLEATAEAIHNRHLLHQAENNLRTEIRGNRELLKKDEEQLLGEKEQYTTNLQLLEALRTHAPLSSEPKFNWYWSSMQNAGWNTARDTGAIALMPYEDAQGFSVVYSQQEYVSRQAEVFIADVYRTISPLTGDRKFANLKPAEIDAMIAATQQTLADISHLRDLCSSLDRIYDNLDKKS